MTDILELAHKDKDELQDALEEMPKRAELYTSPQPIEKCKPIGEMRENGVTWYKQNPHAYPIGTKFYTSPISKEAYDGAREDLAIWKKRALEAEKKVTLYDQRIVDVGVIAMTPIKSPQQREWVGLEHRDVMEAWKFTAKDRTSQTIPEKFAAAIDSKLKQLNTKG